MAPKIEIVALGDIHWDTVTVHRPEEQEDFRSSRTNYTSICRPAGAWLLEKFIRDATDSASADVKVTGYLESSQGIERLTSENWRRALTELKMFPKGLGADPTRMVQRVSLKQTYNWDEESISGGDVEFEPIFKTLNETLLRNIESLPLEARIVVINDPGDVFHHLETSREVVKYFRDAGPNNYFIINMARPLTDREDRARFDHQDTVWNTIDPKRTVVVISTASLRFAGLNIPEDRAVETCAYAFAHYMQSDNLLQKLMESRHLIICDDGGAFHFDNSEQKGKRGKLDFYFQQFEALPVLNPGKYGIMSGYRGILIAAIVQKALLDKHGELQSDLATKDPFQRISDGIRAGLRLWARHFEKGFSHYNFPDAYSPSNREAYACCKDPHPFDHLFPSTYHDKFKAKVDQANIDVVCNKLKLAWVQFALPLDTLKTWNRLTWFREQLAADNPAQAEKKYAEWLIRVVREGLDAAKDELLTTHDAVLCPTATFGELQVVDHSEIDRFLSFHRIIKKYLNDESWKTPLSLAVFGPPGAGKSSTVEEILKAASSSDSKSGNREGALVFNLAQFTTPANLTTAFHQVQDRVLASNEVPLIFFDEFDSTLDGQRYGWLKYFLAPMQDGKFKGAEAEGSYRVGKAIFVFAGGTAETFEAFKKATSQDAPDISNAKGKDFISRLRSFLDIKGIDKSEDEAQVSDILALRRAIILRSILSRKAKDIFNDAKVKVARIDPGLIRAFLRINSYEHGIRSMVAIVEMSKPERGNLQVASLPSPDQLRMHVDDEQFLKLATQDRTL